ncbi:MAG: hypothetical protein F6K62_10490 [Sphaerospermopsis sp. SIO1G2]|nr:hypothetical protein [Sphaerospermopsis sp. SIO1G2]
MDIVALFSDISPTYIWLLLTAMFLTLEAIGISGVGMVFGGIAAFILAIMVEMGLVKSDALLTQSALWFGLTVMIAALLFRPLKRWRTDPSSTDKFENMIGNTAKVAAGGLMLGKPGKVYWSGTLMNAQISPNSEKEAFMEGDMVEIEYVRGNQLIVKTHMDTMEPPTPPASM